MLEEELVECEFCTSGGRIPPQEFSPHMKRVHPGCGGRLSVCPTEEWGVLALPNPVCPIAANHFY